MSPEYIIKKGLEYYNTYGTVEGFYIGSRAVALLADPQDIEVILSSSVHIEKAIEYK